LEKPIKLDAIEFTSTPTPSQLAEVFANINKFLSRCMGSIMAEGDLTANDAKVGLALNAGGLLLQAADQWRGSSPVLQPHMMPPPGMRKQ